MSCCDVQQNGRSAVGAAATMSLLMAVSDTRVVTDNVYTDLLAGQAAPEPATCVVPAMTRGGVYWSLWGTWLQNSGVNRTYDYRITFGGVVLYEATSQNMGTNASGRPWLYTGSITRKSATEAFFGALPLSTTSVAGTTTGLGPFNIVGTNLGPCAPQANAIADVGGLNWGATQTLQFEVRWSAAVAGLSYAISGGYVGLFGG